MEALNHPGEPLLKRQVAIFFTRLMKVMKINPTQVFGQDKCYIDLESNHTQRE